MKSSAKITTCLILFCFLLISGIILTPNIHNDKQVKGIATESFEVQPSLTIDPELNISIFSPYRIYVDNIPGDPNNVFLEVRGINGNGNDCWDYFADGTCGSENIVTTLERYNEGWRTNRIFPDTIYPEIYIADSNATWYNQPLSTSVRRNQYQILHFNNPFTMVNDMYFYIEIDAYPLSTINSTDLEIYLVEKGNNISLFNSQWMDSASVELVGTFSKDSTYHHTHTVNSSHRLVALSTNINGTVGSKNLNINDEFWIVLYSQSPNNSRGWNLQYHPASLCNYENKWYMGNMQGWSTTPVEGCPDVHLHIARRNPEYMDGVGARVTAVYNDVQLVSDEVEFYFGEIPNLPPSATSFTSPSVGGTYSSSLNISWQPATDPNNDPLYYNIYLQKDSVNVLSFEEITSTSIAIEDTTTLGDGNYTVVGEVCDTFNPCVPFSLNGLFTISNTLPIETITFIGLTTSNPSQQYSKAGDSISLTFNTSGVISSPIVDIYSKGDEVKGVVTSNEENNIWTYSFIVANNDSDGEITFSIISDNLDREYYESTDNSSIKIDNTPPEKPVSSLESGIYPSTSTNIAVLSSEGSSEIRYSLVDTNLSCNTGNVYSSNLSILQDTVINVIACDIAGNISEPSTFEYLIKEDLLEISLSSSNQNVKWAKAGDLVDIQFEASNPISTPTVQIFSNNQALTSNYTLTNQFNFTNWRFEYEVQSNDANGIVSFEIISDDLYKTFTDYTIGSEITIDTIPPLKPNSSLEEGLYNSSKLTTLTSIGHIFIRFTTDGSNPSCSNGLLYLYPIGIDSSKTIKAIACDQAGNFSPIGEYTYFIDKTTLQLPTKEVVIFDSEGSQQPELITTEDDIAKELIDPDNITTDIDVGVGEEGSTVQNRYTTRIIRKGSKIFVSEIKVLVLNNNKEGIPNLSLMLFSSPQNTITNSQGIGSFSMVEVGKHTLSFEYKDKSYEKKILIEEPKVYEEEIELEVVEITIIEEEQRNCLIIIYLIPFFLSLGIILFGFKILFVESKRI